MPLRSDHNLVRVCPSAPVTYYRTRCETLCRARPHAFKGLNPPAVCELKESVILSPTFCGGFQGDFSIRFSQSNLNFTFSSAAQRFSPTAVYPPCPRSAWVSSNGLTAGHGGYTAKGSAETTPFSKPQFNHEQPH